MAGASRVVTAVLLAVILGNTFLSSPLRAAVAPDVAAPTATTARLLDGVVASVSGSTLIAQMSDGAQHTYIVSTTVSVTRNSRRSSLAALRPDDQVTVTQDADERITAVDAAGPETPAPAQSSPLPLATATAAPPTEAPTAVTGPRTLDGTLVVANNMGLTAQLSDGTVRDFRPAPQLRVQRNGAGSSLDALQAGDQVTISTDADGAAIEVDAAGPETAGSSAPSSPTSEGSRGTVVAVWAGGIVARVGASVRDIRLTPSLRITRNGKVTRASALRRGDTITLTTDAAGAVTAVAAAGKPATLQSFTASDAAALAAPPLAALLLAACALLYRQIGKPPRSTGE